MFSDTCDEVDNEVVEQPERSQEYLIPHGGIGVCFGSFGESHLICTVKHSTDNDSSGNEIGEVENAGVSKRESGTGDIQKCPDDFLNDYSCNISDSLFFHEYHSLCNVISY